MFPFVGTVWERHTYGFDVQVSTYTNYMSGHKVDGAVYISKTLNLLVLNF